MQIPSF